MGFALNTFGGLNSEAYEFIMAGFKSMREAYLKEGLPVWDVNKEQRNAFQNISAAVQRRNYNIFAANADPINRAPPPPAAAAKARAPATRAAAMTEGAVDPRQGRME